MLIELSIPLLLPSLNSMAGRGHWSTYHKNKATWEKWVLASKLNDAKVYGAPRYEKARVEVDRYCVQKIKDADNLGASTKFLLDAIVSVGLLRDDSIDCVGTPTITQYKCPQEEQRTLVRIYTEDKRTFRKAIA